MKRDPSARRARSIVLLVVITVAIPSMLLAALAAMAVRNEEEASLRRTQRAYQPVLLEVANRFNSELDAVIESLDNPPPLDTDEQIRRYQDRIERFTINEFAISTDGSVVVPHTPAVEGAAAPLPRALANAIDEEVAHLQQADACTAYRRLGSDVDRCLVSLALGLCEAKGKGDAWVQELREACPSLAASSAALDVGLDLTAAASDDPQQLLTAATRLLEALRRRGFETSLWVDELLARRAAGMLQSVTGDEAGRVRRSLLMIAERPRLVEHLATVKPRRAGRRAVFAEPVDDWYRVLILGGDERWIHGLELSPPAVEAYFNEQLATLNLEVPVRARVFPLNAPAWLGSGKIAEEQVAAWAFLKKTNLAWEITLIFDTPPGSLLSGTRATLYIWLLGLVVLLLIAGIVYTVRAVINEARDARLKADFVSSVSHDLRTPLTSIRMFTETLLLGRVRNKEDERECLETIASETERLSRLTERILDFSRLEAGRKAYTFKRESLSEIVKQAVAACQPLVDDAGFDVQVAVAAQANAVAVDRDAMIEVLINLLSNAIKYSPEDRRVRIEARRAGDCVELAVVDHGIGIPRNEQKRIFEKFYRVDCRRTTEVGGSGLGLSLVKHIVTAHGGDVRVDSTPGRGSTFTVRLPAASAATPIEEQQHGDDTGGGGRSLDRARLATKP